MPLRQKQHQPVVVVAEADTTQRQDIRTHLRKAEFTVVEAADTETTMSALEGRSDVRALVTNTHLTTQLDGVEVARQVRDRWPAIGIVLMSGHSDPSPGPVPEGTEFIAKPFLFEHLVPTLTRLIHKAD